MNTHTKEIIKKLQPLIAQFAKERPARYPAGFTVRTGKVVDAHAGIVRSVHRRSAGRG